MIDALSKSVRANAWEDKAILLIDRLFKKEELR
jgi:hypothetical protein